MQALTSETTGNNTDFSLNFIPKMNKERLINCYKSVINGIYGGKEYYKRVLDFLKRFTPNNIHKRSINKQIVVAFIRSMPMPMYLFIFSCKAVTFACFSCVAFAC